MSNIEVQYEVQELVGHIIKEWKPVTYLTEWWIANQYYEKYKDKSNEIRLVKVETIKTTIEEN